MRKRVLLQKLRLQPYDRMCVGFGVWDEEGVGGSRNPDKPGGGGVE